MQTIREWLTENRPKHKNRVMWIAECSQALNVSRKAVQNVASQLWPFAQPDVKKGSFSQSNKAECDVISSVTFLTEIDDVSKVIKFLNESVKDNYIDEEKLRRRFGIPQARWKDIVGLPIFESRRLVYQKPGSSKVVVFSSSKGIEAAKKTISMARYEQ